jgi:hypothetical protein
MKRRWRRYFLECEKVWKIVLRQMIRFGSWEEFVFPFKFEFLPNSVSLMMSLTFEDAPRVVLCLGLRFSITHFRFDLNLNSFPFLTVSDKMKFYK